VRRAAVRAPEATAVTDAEGRLSWSELHDEVRNVARALVTLGVRRGDRVCVWAPNSRQWVVSALATTYVGAVLVPVNSRYTGHEAIDLVRRSRARVVVVAQGFLGRDQVAELQAAATQLGGPAGSPLTGCPDTAAIVTIGPADVSEVPGIVRFGDLARLAGDTPLDAVEAMADAVFPDDLADILFTSGTTGRSKGACSSHRQTLAVAGAWADEGELTADDCYFVVNPFFHAFGYKAGLVSCLLRGTTVVTRPVFGLEDTLALLRDEGVSVLAAAPPVFQSLLGAPDGPARSGLRLAVTGATLVPVALVERIQTELGCRSVLTAYGLTEAVVATMCQATDTPEVVAHTVGRPVAGFEVRVVDPVTGEAAATGAAGEVLLRGPNVMLGYLDDPRATAEAVDLDGWLHTGDVGTLDVRGYLTITDRLKDVVIVGGFNVYPAEVEQVLACLDDVIEAAAVGVPDERLGEVTKAYVVRRASSSLDTARVLEHCRERLANFKVPRSVEFVDQLPRSATGKVLRRELKQREQPVRG
jgi:HIP---CoA ligase